MWQTFMRWLARAPAAQAEQFHEGLGTLRYYDGWWEGALSTATSNVELTLDGDATGPHPELLKLAASQARNLDRLVDRVSAYLAARDPTANALEFTVTGLSYYAEPAPAGSQWVVWLELASDKNALWQLLMTGEEPTELCRDG